MTSAKAKYLTTPVTKIDGEIVLGFDEKRVVSLLDVQRLGDESVNPLEIVRAWHILTSAARITQTREKI